MLEGAAQGDKRKADYKSLEVWPCNSLTKNIAGGVGAEPAAAAPVLPPAASPSALDKVCISMFGNLAMKD